MEHFAESINFAKYRLILTRIGCEILRFDPTSGEVKMRFSRNSSKVNSFFGTFSAREVEVKYWERFLCDFILPKGGAVSMEATGVDSIGAE